MPVSINGNGSITGLVITTADLADGSVTTAKIAAGAVATVDIADSAVTTAKIADANVTTAKIADSAITSGKIADGAVATADIADSAVTTAKIANANVTVAKISATGTPSSTTFLAGDGSWQTISTTPPSTFDAVGTYAALYNASNTNLAIGATVAGSSLRYNVSTNGTDYRTGNPFATGRYRVSNSTYDGGGTAVSGTWRKMSTGDNFSFFSGCSNVYVWSACLYIRIS
jgi:hypothetical protein